LNTQTIIEELLEAKEGEGFQFKEGKNRFDAGEAARCCCALANCGGGRLVFGITDKRPRQVVGSTAFEQPERTRMGLIEKLKIMVDFQIHNCDGKRVLIFDVASRPLGLPVQVDGVAWWYEGDSLIPMPEDVRRRIYEESGAIFQAKFVRLLVWMIWKRPQLKNSATNGSKKAETSGLPVCLYNNYFAIVKQLPMMGLSMLH